MVVFIEHYVYDLIIIQTKLAHGHQQIGGGMKFEIKSRWSGKILFEAETKSLEVAVKLAVEKGADLRGADLWGADLRGAYLRGAEIEFCQFPSIRTLSSMPLKHVSDEISLELMRLDAEAHPKPELFDEWAKGGDCPYQNEERWWWMPEKRDVWKPGKPTMKLSDLIIEICRQEGWGIRGYLPLEESC